MDENYCHPFKQFKLSVQNNIIVSRTTSLINLKVVFNEDVFWWCLLVPSNLVLPQVGKETNSVYE